MVVDDEGASPPVQRRRRPHRHRPPSPARPGKKIRVFTYKNKSRQHKRRGHRQPRTTLTVDSI
jgi:hypothetical protein